MNALMPLFDRYADRYGMLAARILIGLLFVVTGALAALNFGGTAAMIASTGLPLAFILTIIVLALKLGGGLSVILGYRVRCGALALIFFTILATVFFHIGDTVGLLKNLAIIGGLVLIYRASPAISSNNTAPSVPYGTQ